MKKNVLFGLSVFCAFYGSPTSNCFFFSNLSQMKVVNISQSQTFDGLFENLVNEKSKINRTKFYEYKSTAHSKDEMRMVRVTNYLVFVLIAR